MGFKKLSSSTMQELKELFTEPSKCDFCEKENRIILRIVIHPLLSFNEEIANCEAIAIAKKCINCISEGNK